ncbi:MAG: hypothetical protein HZC24_10290, partial [Rhodocyclales bacterium]|nr:hypothetical protein [Rhodocyclales bacterium]
MHRLIWIVLLPAIVLTSVGWATLRIGIESRLTEAAQRDLQTIADVVAADIERIAAERPALKGAALARAASAADSVLAQSLAHASSEYFRSVYFFDNAGHVT